jgi:hypothetical protein
LGFGERAGQVSKEFVMDRYTKFNLTVIAVSLLWISLHVGDLVPNAFAGYAITKIEIVDVSVSSHRALPVVIKGKVNCSD